jgi:ankyrin repeat protein
MMGCESIAIHEAYKRGDLEALKKLMGNPPDFPNTRSPGGFVDSILEYAIYHSPAAFVRTLLESGANPNYEDPAGFPSLIALISTDREDRYELAEMLLSFGADTRQRGVNDYTPLHYAVAKNDAKLIELLLAHGADPDARTRIDDYATPAEEAEIAGHQEALAALRKQSGRA